MSKIISKYTSIDIFGEEKFNHIKKGIIKLYGVYHPGTRYGQPETYKEIAIPLHHIPGNDGCEYLWSYDPHKKENYGFANIFEISNESTWGGKMMYTMVQVEKPVRFHLYHLEKEKREKEEAEEKLYVKNLKKDDSVDEIFKFYARNCQNDSESSC